jgi:GAF domain/ANTAR domain
VVSDDDSVPPEPGHRAKALAAVASAVADATPGGLPADLQRLCRAAVETLGLAGAAVHVMTDADRGAVAASSDAASSVIAEATFGTGDGPNLDAFLSARPVLVSDLEGEGRGRWPGFLEAVQGLGVAAVYSFPLSVGAVRLGVLDLYGGQAGGLSPDQMSLALTFVDLATQALLDEPGQGPEPGLDVRLRDAFDRRSEIYQAQGMVMVDLGVSLAASLALMRAEAFARHVALVDVAREIVAGGGLSRCDTEEDQW